MRCVDVERAFQKALAVKVEENRDTKPLAEKQILKRNALNISESATASGEASTVYSDFLKNQWKVNQKLIAEIECVFVELVQTLDAQPNMSSVSYSFRPMHSEQRRVVHEYASYFGIETKSYDQEPQRNVAATAKR
ncbi:unnamed protein product [Gongylonema pulchrum]|uniref:R3H domain-containing protein n=1 Tax=Gongylonema pulchrum TaxID=637853 RepID=A0A183DYL1_9BILA|nr:unnamed protein product [Gongylonema pulchrum]